MTTSLPRTAPSAQGVDADGIHAFLDEMDRADAIELHSLMVLRHGAVVAEGWWAPYTADAPHLLYSLSKSFTSTAAGIAAGEGLLDLDRTVLSYFPELDADITDERSRRMLVRHIASMASGHTSETLDRAVAADRRNPIRGFLLTPPEEEPGTVFAYNQPCTFTLGAIVERQTGLSLTEYLRPRLFDPIGIGEVGWQHVAGHDMAFSGLHAPTEAIARLGQLYLQRGRWGDRQLVPEAWVDAATSIQVENPNEPNPDWSRGYGFQFWKSRHGFRGDGAFGQFCLVLPEQDAVIVTTAQTLDMQGILDAVWRHLLPALGADAAGSAATASESRLVERLASLALEPLGATRVPDGAASPHPATWHPAVGGIADQPTLTGATLREDADGWALELHEGDVVHTARLGLDGHWTTSVEGVPMAAASTPLPDGGLHVEVIFLETPHRLVLDLSGDTAAGFGARWLTPPLRAGSLSDLRMPRP